VSASLLHRLRQIEEQIAVLHALFRSLEAEIESLKKVEPRRGPGRPPKHLDATNGKAD
jgi:hypothetical protein